MNLSARPTASQSIIPHPKKPLWCSLATNKITDSSVIIKHIYMQHTTKKKKKKKKKLKRERKKEKIECKMYKIFRMLYTLEASSKQHLSFRCNDVITWTMVCNTHHNHGSSVWICSKQCFTKCTIDTPKPWWMNLFL